MDYTKLIKMDRILYDMVYQDHTIYVNLELRNGELLIEFSVDGRFAYYYNMKVDEFDPINVDEYELIKTSIGNMEHHPEHCIRADECDILFLAGINMIFKKRSITYSIPVNEMTYYINMVTEDDDTSKFALCVYNDVNDDVLNGSVACDTQDELNEKLEKYISMIHQISGILTS